MYIKYKTYSSDNMTVLLLCEFGLIGYCIFGSTKWWLLAFIPKMGNSINATAKMFNITYWSSQMVHWWDPKKKVTRRNQHSQEWMTHATGTAFLTRDLDLDLDIDLRPFDTKINGFPWLIVEHLYVKFGDSCYIGFEISCKKQTDRQTKV